MGMNSTGGSFSRQRQKTVFTSGFRGSLSSVPSDPDRLIARARKLMSEQAYAYVAGGAGCENTVEDNRRAFGRWQLQPRMLRDVSTVDTQVQLFDRSLPVPFMLAPIGVLEMAHPDADRAVARAAAQSGVPFIFSSQASVSMERCAEVMDDSPRWFQLYWSKSNALVQSFVKRAEQCGCEAIVLTLDTTMLGWRPRDLDLGYLPFLEGRGLAQYINDPVFQQMTEDCPPPDSNDRLTFTAVMNLIWMCRRYPGSFWTNLTQKRPLKAVKTFIDTYSRPSLTWQDLEFLRGITDLPILLKGILRPDDAQRAIDHGMDGVIVSNHGGRQVDGALPALEALQAIAQAVKGRIPVLFDSGIRTGSDILKALALGADSVLIGRPYVYGLAIDGARGVREVLDNLRADLELNMGLCGCRSLDELRQNDLLVPRRGRGDTN